MTDRKRIINYGEHEGVIVDEMNGGTRYVARNTENTGRKAQSGES